MPLRSRTREGTHAHGHRLHRRTRSRSRSPSSSSSEADSRFTSLFGSSSELSGRPARPHLVPLRAINPAPGGTSSEDGATRGECTAAATSTEAEALVLTGDGRGSDDMTATWVSTSPPSRNRSGKRSGEVSTYVHLNISLQANLAAAHKSRSESTSKRARMLRESASLPIMDFTGWYEAWSVYFAVLASFYPHVAPRLFPVAAFLSPQEKSRAFRASAWLRYNREFHLKLAVSRSWNFEIVDTELWASCFAVDSLAPAAPASAGMHVIRVVAVATCTPSVCCGGRAEDLALPPGPTYRRCRRE